VDTIHYKNAQVALVYKLWSKRHWKWLKSLNVVGSVYTNFYGKRIWSFQKMILRTHTTVMNLARITAFNLTKITNTYFTSSFQLQPDNISRNWHFEIQNFSMLQKRNYLFFMMKVILCSYFTVIPVIQLWNHHCHLFYINHFLLNKEHSKILYNLVYTLASHSC
jgi:hypothetical protein